LNADIHKAEVIGEWWRHALRTITARRARAFILDLANMAGSMPNTKVVPPRDLTGAERLVKRFPDFFLPPFPDDTYEGRRFLVVMDLMERTPVGQERVKSLRDAVTLALLDVIALRDGLRRIWLSDNERRNWAMHGIREKARRLTAHPRTNGNVLDEMLKDGPPPKDALQQALIYFQSHIRLARRCANSNCKITPYYLADKPNQRYCSEPCSHLADAERKSQWWAEHGEQWRKARKRATKKGKKHAKR
jgi:hypothetical protein